MIAVERPPCDVGLLRAERQVAPCPRRLKPWVLAACVLGSSIAFINGSVVNVALPAIQAALDASVEDVQWIMNGYALFLAALILVGGSAGDQYGQKRVFVIGIVVFALAAVWSGLAPGTGQLILARILQGIGAALLVPTSLAILATTFEAAERGKAIGIWAGFAALTSAVGPVLGGWLVDALSWRWALVIVVPIALAALAIARWRMPPLRPQAPPAGLDWKGAVLATLGLAALTYALIDASRAGLGSPRTLATLLGGALLLGFFVAVEARIPSPMMPPGLFRSLTFTGANLLTFFLYFALGGVLFFLPFDLIQVQGYSASQAGAAFLPFTLLMGGLSGWAGGLVERYGARKPLVVGPLVAAAGLALFALPGVGGSYWTTFFPAMLTLGLGMAISVAPLTTTVMSTFEGPRAGIASGINNAVARVAGLLAVAVLGVIALGLFSATLEARLAGLAIPPELRQAVYAERGKLAGIEAPAALDAAQKRAVEHAVGAAFVRSFRVVMLVIAGLALVSALCALVTIKPVEASGPGPPGP